MCPGSVGRRPVGSGRPASWTFAELLAAAERDLEGVAVDGVTSYWDFPSSCLAAILAEAQADQGVLVAPGVPHRRSRRPARRARGAAAADRPSRHAVPGGLTRIDLPDEVAAVPGTWAIAEGLLDGHQCTVEGFVHDGEVAIHGVFDIHRGDNGSTFTDYVYPSRLPDDVRARMGSVATDLVRRAGYDQAPFNIEFFWDRDAERTWILEVNPRISREHADLMRWVDDTSNLQVMARTALGEDPELEDQEPYSYELADLYLAGSSEEDVEAKRRAVVDALDIRFAPLPDRPSAPAA